MVTISDDSLSASDDVIGAERVFAGGSVWGPATGVWSSRDCAERRHLLGTLGTHTEISDDLMLGGMLQLDSVAGDLSGGTGEIRPGQGLDGGTIYRRERGIGAAAIPDGGNSANLIDRP